MVPGQFVLRDQWRFYLFLGDKSNNGVNKQNGNDVMIELDGREINDVSAIAKKLSESYCQSAYKKR